MRPSLVNGLAFITAVCTVSVACSSADGRAQKNGDTTPSAAQVASGSATTDSLARAADTSRILGSAQAPVWLIEVSDFQCPFCKQWHDQTYSMIINDYVKTGKVRLAYVNFPLSIHANARAAATAAMCAGAQGKFWPMHDALFATQERWEGESDPSTTFDSLATSLGVKAADYHACLTSPSIAGLINGDQDRAQRGGVGSTPSFWVGSKLVEGAVPPAEMRAELDRALAEAAAAGPAAR